MSQRTTALAFAAIVVASLGFGLVQAAEAGTITLTRDGGKYSGSPGGLQAGEFGVTSYNGSTVGSMGSGVQVGGNVFQTFCLETTEPLSLGTQYTSVVGTAASSGGYSGGNPDSLDARTAYLVNAFWTGTLTGYTYSQGGGRVSSATALQLAIWHLEGEIQPGALTTAYNGNAQAQAWVSAATAAVASGQWSGLGNVRVLTLTGTGGQAAQDVLVVIGDTVTPVPLPPAVLAGLGLMAGLSGFGALRRKRQALA